MKPMKSSDIVLIVMFVVNSWIYLQFDHNSRVAHILQSIIALISIGCIAWLRISFQSIPFVLVVLFSGLFLTLSFYYNILQYSMFIPLLFTFGLERILKKYQLILEVLAQSLWMFLSITFSFCVFGFGSYYLFHENKEYFLNLKTSTLTYLQVATLDEVGKVTRLNYQHFGLPKAFGVMVASLLVFHTLFNINQAIIMQFVYRKRHNQIVISSRQQLIGEDIHIKFKIVRILNVACSTFLFIFPFQQQQFYNWIILTLAAISTISIFVQHTFQDSLIATRNTLNIFLFISACAMLISKYQGIFYLLCGVRIFLIRQVLGLWRKITNVVWQTSPMLSLTLFFFMIFALLAYTLEKFQTKQKQFKIETAFIKALQFMTLDDWTPTMRRVKWYSAALTTFYIILLNHIILNGIISQSFGQLQQQAQQQIAKNKVKQTRLSRFQKASEMIINEINDQNSSQDFWSIAAALGYQKKQQSNPLNFIFEQQQYDSPKEQEVQMANVV